MVNLRPYLNILFTASLFVVFVSCSRTDIDDIYPVIDITDAGSFPQNCDTLFVGETFVFRAVFSDNRELGAFSLDIHHNFDQHAHSTESISCPMDAKKVPSANAFLFVGTYNIPPGTRVYHAEVPITIPQNADTGDYHLFIALTDREGWQTVKGLSIKIMDAR